MKQVSGVHSDPPLLLSHSAASMSCDSRLEEHLTPRQLRVADPEDDDLSESSRYLLQHVHAPASLAGNNDVAVHRVLCPYHQLVATNSAANVAEPAAFLAFQDSTVRRGVEQDLCLRADEHAVGGAAVYRHEIDLLRDSLSNTATRNSCDRQAVELERVSAGGDGAHAERWRTTSTLDGDLSRTVGRPTDVSFTCHQQDDTPTNSHVNLAHRSNGIDTSVFYRLSHSE